MRNLRHTCLAGVLASLLSASLSANDKHIYIDLSDQTLYLYNGKQLEALYRVSSSKYGGGNQVDSLQTPLGLHRIAAKFGANLPLYTVFEKRQATAVIQAPSPDLPKVLITSRILQLQGRVRGVNLGGNVDTLARGIYIHGTTAEHLIGEPASNGCIRMKNQEVVDLFARVSVSTPVTVRE